jgi:hypothetical protein
MSTPHNPTGSDASQGVDADEAIPTLSEIVHLPRYSPPELPPTLSDVDWAALTQRIQDNVLGRLMRRSELLFGAQLRATLKSVLDRTAEQMSAELQVTLSQLTRDLVARAVAEEITKVHDEIARRESGAGDHSDPDPLFGDTEPGRDTTG